MKAIAIRDVLIEDTTKNVKEISGRMLGDLSTADLMAAIEAAPEKKPSATATTGTSLSRPEGIREIPEVEEED